MGLIGKIFGGAKDKDAAAQASAEATQFHESDSTDDEGGGSATKRELVQVMLRDTMRKHGIPSDWIECRMISTTTRARRPALHVQFIVRQGHERLLSYVFAFQDSFQREVTRFDPRAGDWLLSVSWCFEGHLNPMKPTMPDPKTWGGAAGTAAAAAAAAAAMPAVADTAESPTGFEPTQDPVAEEDEDVSRDLRALFAIRDAVIADTRPDDDKPDFEPTRPGFDDDLPRR